ncbi:MAG: glycosyltransferase family 2 protein [Bdellovibrionales bacterium]|nr:glycosyltransferase family 2 protein [Bdellovibrionales bacterium]
MIVKISIVTFCPPAEVFNQVLFHLERSVLYLLEQSSKWVVYLDIIDNSPNDDFFNIVQERLKLLSESGCRYIRLIKTKNNIGFGRAHNISLLEDPCEYNLVLNPDVYLEKDTLHKCTQCMSQHPHVGLLSPQVTGLDGERHYLVKQNPTFLILFLRSFAPHFLKKKLKPLIDRFEMREKDYDQPIWDAPYLTGCFMFFRNTVIRQINGFDEKYFLYLEDADITRETLEVSRTLYHPDVRIIHLWERGAHKKIKLALINLWSYVIYSNKWTFR